MNDTIPPISVSIWQHDDRRYIFNVKDQDGVDIPDVTVFSELTFIIAPYVTSPPFLTKTFSGGDIIMLPPSQVYFDIRHAESGALQPGNFYCELKGISAGTTQTLGAGTATVIDTNIGDYS